MSHAPRERLYRWGRRGALLAILALLVDCTVLGDLRLSPGFAQFSSPGMRDTDLRLALSLGPATLGVVRLVASRHRKLAPLLGDLSAARVYVYSVRGDGGRVRERIERMRSRLIDSGWTQPVAVREDDETVLVLVKPGPRGTLAGAAAVVEEDDELVLANIMGDLAPESVGGALSELCDLRGPPAPISGIPGCGVGSGVAHAEPIESQ